MHRVGRVPARLAGVLAIVSAGAIAAGCGGGGAPARATTVTLALDFTPNAVHAPIYAAVRRGFDRRYGVRLRIQPPGSAPDALKLVASGRADMAVLDIHDLGLARERGQDFVGLAALVQGPLAAIIARARVRRPRELEGRRVGVSGLPSDVAVLRAVLDGDGADPRRVKRVTIGFAAVPSLIEGRVDAVPAFWNAEGVVLHRRGVPIHEFRVERFGAPRYPEVVLFTSRRTLERRRAAIAGTVRAIRQGVNDVLAHPGPAVREIANAGNSEPGLVRAQLRAVTPLFRPPLALNRQALEAWARFDVRFGVLRRRPDVSRAFEAVAP
jgi:NitT/TauT family transport system substrate-binding protein/putative hydroxymethylpyrimidine transport system substrate-binding protein